MKGYSHSWVEYLDTDITLVAMATLPYPYSNDKGYGGNHAIKLPLKFTLLS